MVWSDPEIKKLAGQFVTVTEEVHFLYPEGEWALNRVKDEPAHRFFKRFGEAMPEGDWNHPGTKQGVYMIGPNAEYLEGGGAISGDAPQVRERLKRALERWSHLRKEKKYRNAPVPAAQELAPPPVAGKPLVFRVFLRDLPRGKGDESGRRFREADLRGIWPHFVQWAWNVNWIAFDDPTDFLPEGKKPEPLDPAVLGRLAREVLVDNVRGQQRAWAADHLKAGTLTMRRVRTTKSAITIAYEGSARLEDGGRNYLPTLRGRAIWNRKERRFDSFELVAIGSRTGRGRFNQRGNDPGPAPMGVAITLFRPVPSLGRR